jgi:hypothetical protein
MTMTKHELIGRVRAWRWWPGGRPKVSVRPEARNPGVELGFLLDSQRGTWHMVVGRAFQPDREPHERIV